MATRHTQISVRDDQKDLSADKLRGAFNTHQCAEGCLILKSEAELAGFHPVILAASELQECKLYLHSNPGKRKSAALDTPDTNIAHKRQCSSIESCRTSFPIIISEDKKDDIVRKFRQATDNASFMPGWTLIFRSWKEQFCNFD